MTLGVVVIGLGNMGMLADLSLDPDLYVYSHARGFHQHPKFKLLAGIDSSAQRRAEFVAAYDRPVFLSISEALRLFDPDVVALAVPTEAHAIVLEQVMAQRAPRAILCEKPLAYTLNEAARIVSLCSQAGTQLFVNYVRRSDPAVREIKSWLQSGKLILPLKGVAWYSKGLYNNGSHFLDLLKYWLGDFQGFKVIQARTSWADDPEPDFLTNFEGGQIHFLSANERDYSHYNVELVSPSGRIRYDAGGGRVLWQSVIRHPTLPGYKVLDSNEQEIPNDLSKIQLHVVNQLSLALAGQPAAICTGDQALRTNEHLASICADL